LGGAEMARTEGYSDGRVPLHTLRANIDYGFFEARPTTRRIGGKCWVKKGGGVARGFRDQLTPAGGGAPRGGPGGPGGAGWGRRRRRSGWTSRWRPRRSGWPRRPGRRPRWTARRRWSLVMAPASAARLRRLQTDAGSSSSGSPLAPPKAAPCVLAQLGFRSA